MKLAQLLLPAAMLTAGTACGNPPQGDSGPSQPADSLAVAPVAPDTVKAPPADPYATLTDDDFKAVADELGVEVAAIKAVVVIEAGQAMKGFYAPGVPVANFDASMFSTYGRRASNRAGDPKAEVPKGLTGYALREYTQLTAARKRNRDGADMGTFWGMFQIGGFNYKLCGCSTVGEMVEAMSRSEHDQLELFAQFLINTGYVDFLRRRDWAGFARRFNGASYARRGYHTKMAAAYNRFKREAEKKNKLEL